MTATPVVSVIIPTYNRAHVVGNAIDSVLGQTYTPVEVIVVDDGSTDETQAKLAAYADRIRVLKQENSGPTIARNRGIAAAQGEIVAFLDSDDYWLPDKLLRQVDLLQRAGESVPCCLCNCTILYNDGGRGTTFTNANIRPNPSTGLWLNPAQVLSTRFVLFNQAVAIRRSVLERVGYFDETLRFAEDYELPLRLALQGPWVITCEELAVCRAGHSDGWGARALQEEIRYRQDLIRMWKGLVTIVEANPSHAGLRRTMRARVRSAKRDLLATRLSRATIPGAAFAGQTLRLTQRIWDAVIRRSPFYPRTILRELI